MAQNIHKLYVRKSGRIFHIIECEMREKKLYWVRVQCRLLSPCSELEQNDNLQNADVVIVFVNTFYTQSLN